MKKDDLILSLTRIKNLAMVMIDTPHKKVRQRSYDALKFDIDEILDILIKQVAERKDNG